MMETAASMLFPGMHVFVQHSIGQGFYCEFHRDRALIPAEHSWLQELKEKMQELISRDEPIVKHNLNLQEAIDFFREIGRPDKARLLRYRRSSRVNLYDLLGYREYYYGYMAPSTGYLKCFDILPYQKGFMLMFPDRDTRTVAEFFPLDKLFGDPG